MVWIVQKHGGQWKIQVSSVFKNMSSCEQSLTAPRDPRAEIAQENWLATNVMNMNADCEYFASADGSHPWHLRSPHPVEPLLIAFSDHHLATPNVRRSLHMICGELVLEVRGDCSTLSTPDRGSNI